MNESFVEKQIDYWERMLSDIFEKNVPGNKEWHDPVSIAEVLNNVANSKAMNHTFLPTGGGNDLNGCRLSNEEDCIEMKLDGIATVVKPKRLIFNYYGKDISEWSFFYLELESMKDSGVYEVRTYEYEELVEVSPAEYKSRNNWDSFREYYPESSRIVIRNLEGNFVIFSKASTYNQLNGTYDGRHSKLGYEGFEKQVKDVVEKLK